MVSGDDSKNSDHVCFYRFNYFGSCFVCFWRQHSVDGLQKKAGMDLEKNLNKK